MTMREKNFICSLVQLLEAPSDRLPSLSEHSLEQPSLILYAELLRSYYSNQIAELELKALYIDSAQYPCVEILAQSMLCIRRQACSKQLCMRLLNQAKQASPWQGELYYWAAQIAHRQQKMQLASDCFAQAAGHFKTLGCLQKASYCKRLSARLAMPRKDRSKKSKDVRQRTSCFSKLEQKIISILYDHPSSLFSIVDTCFESNLDYEHAQSIVVAAISNIEKKQPGLVIQQSAQHYRLRRNIYERLVS